MATSQPLERAYELPGAARTSERAPATISIVMPCLNEEQTVEPCVRKALSWLERSQFSGEVVVVDNGSTDTPLNWPPPRAPAWCTSRVPATAPPSGGASPKGGANGWSWATATIRTISVTSIRS